MTELNVKYPATQKAPEPSGPGQVIHSYFDLTSHQGDEAHMRYIKALTIEEKNAVLADMPKATVTFYELPEGEEFFDVADHPRDKNGFAIWDTVWVKDIADIGAIEAVHRDIDEYDVLTGGDLLRMKPDQIKLLRDLNEEEDEQLQQLAAKERTPRLAS